MKSSLKTFLTFTGRQRAGLVSLFVLVIVLQLFYHFSDFTNKPEPTAAQREWLAVQKELDSLKKLTPETPKLNPFNPNFISDFKGYKLGMSVAEIDRLLEFRKTGRYVNSAEEFQKVTEVSDSLLAAISPYFKFPDWVKNKKPRFYAERYIKRPAEKIVVKDINLATSDELIAVYGIGPALSERILKMRESLGGFVSMDQMEHVWGLSPDVVAALKEKFTIAEIPAVKKIRVNDASVKELSQFPYFRYPLSKDIVTFRSMNGGIKSADDLVKIRNFPVEKVNIIAVYLEF